ncbi:MAG: hypothetical protein ABFD13_01500 [Candidatus Cryosericum sp.]
MTIVIVAAGSMPVRSGFVDLTTESSLEALANVAEASKIHLWFVGCSTRHAGVSRLPGSAVLMGRSRVWFR